ncbi:hypothetical protein [Ferribacterium limneticum]|uniref:hypothetical protein n=1 Tax=Ferribacterium limneticum TaxID=76259 RepID=UPI001CFA2A0D|nr:hypothetical protein [Ferribacterium limneticum]UCV18272.1 hypothetical protein KI610_15920 [Ferribacterium limneticum]
MKSKRLVVLLDDNKRFGNFRYVLSLLIASWEQQGWRILFCDDFGMLPEAELALLHVNRTVIPESIVDNCLARYQIVINHGALDISKRVVSRQLLLPDSQDGGPVIVKTDANCGGRRERYEHEVFGPLLKIKDRLLPWTMAARLAGGCYPIYRNVAEVPEDVWKNPALVVERLCCERVGELFALRQWVFFGNEEMHRISYSPEALLKSHNIIRSEMLSEVPPFLRQRREELGFDYGKFDYVMFEGEAILLDANRTPTYGMNIGPEVRDIAGRLAWGISFFHAQASN